MSDKNNIKYNPLAGKEEPLFNNTIFEIKSINSVIDEALKEPEPRKLFNDFWNEKELSILFADTGKGKTVLSFQIAEMIAKGQSIGNFCCEVEPSKILYFDYELTGKQIELRYKTDTGAKVYRFSENFNRVTVDPSRLSDDFDEGLFLNQIEELISRYEAKFVIIDNITYLITEIEKSKTALPLMRRLVAMKKKYELSILVIAHTPKRDESKPITMNNLNGSKMIANFIDNLFAIGQSSKDSNLFYLKRLKFRTGINTDEIAVCERKKDIKSGLLFFEYIKSDYEHNHLKESDKNDRDDEILKLHQDGKSYNEIAKELGISKGTVSNVINKK